jgi:hypothetical protein
MYIAAILHNAQTDRFHPVLLMHSPTPTAQHTYINAGHHPEGFTSVTAAHQHINQMPMRVLDSGEIIDWDGKRIDLAVSFSASALANLKNSRTKPDSLLPR